MYNRICYFINVQYIKHTCWYIPLYKYDIYIYIVCVPFSDIFFEDVADTQ